MSQKSVFTSARRNLARSLSSALQTAQSNASDEYTLTLKVTVDLPAHGIKAGDRFAGKSLPPGGKYTWVVLAPRPGGGSKNVLFGKEITVSTDVEVFLRSDEARLA